MQVIKPTRVIRNYAVDSTKWHGFEFREGDIVIGTFSKSGTTLTQQIVSELLSNGTATSMGSEQSPWVDCTFMLDSRRAAEAIPGRRFLKSHLPADALPIDSRVRYINVGRDPRDVFWSWHNHHMSFNEGFYEFAASVGSHWPRPDPDIRRSYLAWIDGSAGEEVHGGYCQYAQSWWNLRDQPNVLLVHFNQYKADLEAVIRRIASFLDIEVDERQMPAILEHCSLDYMRKVSRASDVLNMLFQKGGESFFHKGTNGRWKDVLTPEEAALADRMIDAGLTADCARWIRTGEMLA